MWVWCECDSHAYVYIGCVYICTTHTRHCHITGVTWQWTLPYHRSTVSRWYGSVHTVSRHTRHPHITVFKTHPFDTPRHTRHSPWHATTHKTQPSRHSRHSHITSFSVAWYEGDKTHPLTRHDTQDTPLDTPRHTRHSTPISPSSLSSDMGWFWSVGSIKWEVSFAKEPYKRDNILQKRPRILLILLTVASPYECDSHMRVTAIWVWQPYECDSHEWLLTTQKRRDVRWQSPIRW